MTIIRRQTAWMGLAIFLMLVNCASAGTLSDVLSLKGISFLTVANRTVSAEDEPWFVKCTDQNLIEKLAEVIGEGRPSQDHKCSNIGTITFHFKDGKTVKLGFLPGHDEKFYQFRLPGSGRESIYHIERSVFLDALEAVGYPVKDPRFPR